MKRVYSHATPDTIIPSVLNGLGKPERDNSQGERKVRRTRLPRALGVCANRVFAVENVGPNKTRQLSFAHLGDFAFALVEAPPETANRPASLFAVLTAGLQRAPSSRDRCVRQTLTVRHPYGDRSKRAWGRLFTDGDFEV